MLTTTIYPDRAGTWSWRCVARNGRIVDVPIVTTGGAPGLNQNDISTSHVPAVAVSRACSGPA